MTDWARVRRRLRRQPGKWIQEEDVPNGALAKIKRGGIAPLRDIGGRLEAYHRSTKTINGTRRGILFLRWTPDERKKP